MIFKSYLSHLCMIENVSTLDECVWLIAYFTGSV